MPIQHIYVRLKFSSRKLIRSKLFDIYVSFKVIVTYKHILKRHTHTSVISWWCTHTKPHKTHAHVQCLRVYVCTPEPGCVCATCAQWKVVNKCINRFEQYGKISLPINPVHLLFNCKKCWTCANFELFIFEDVEHDHPIRLHCRKCSYHLKHDSKVNCSELKRVAACCSALQLGFPNYVELIDPTFRDAEGVD